MSTPSAAKPTAAIVSTAIVGLRTAPFRQRVDARWLMAYAAGVGDRSPCYLDTLCAESIVGHPLFVVGPEWPVILAVRDAQLAAGATMDVIRRGVHASHDVTVHRLVRPGDELTTTATVVGIEHRSPGAYLTMELETVDAAGAKVATTQQGTIYLGSATDGPDVLPPQTLPPLQHIEPATDALVDIVDISAIEAHTYTECARIWNPIHTDVAVAMDAGLPGLILHGTATLAKAVSIAVARHANGDPARVARVACRFAATVAMPERLTVRTELHGNVVSIAVETSQGQQALRTCSVTLR